MGQGLSDITFEEWIIHIFDHQVTDPAWYWDKDAEWWDYSPEDAIDYMTRFFENAGAILTPYSDAQINVSLWYMASNAASDYMRVLEDSAVPIDARKQCIQAIFNLYQQVFAKRCTQHLSQFSSGPEIGSLNSICYMW